MWNTKKLRTNCNKCWVTIDCSDSKRVKRGLPNDCLDCYREYQREYRSRDYVIEKRKQESDKRRRVFTKNELEYKILSRYFSIKRKAIRKWAQRRWIDVSSDITTKYLIELYRKHNWFCMISWIPLDLNKDSIKPNTLSIDRIDNNKWYVDWNIQIVCFMYNAMKNIYTDNDCFNFMRACLSKKE